jgi:hypothetical protein
MTPLKIYYKLTYSIGPIFKGGHIYIFFLVFDTYKMNTVFLSIWSYFFFPGSILVPVCKSDKSVW